MSQINICNQALGHLGAKPIASIDENTQEARFCKIFYDDTLEEVLRDFPWNFAEMRRILASVDVPTAHANWSYAYAYPSDCVRALEISENSDLDREAKDYEIMTYEDGAGLQSRLILTNVEVANLKYTAFITDTGLFEASFVASFALLLASKLAQPITKDIKVVQLMTSLYTNSIPRAKTADMKEHQDTSEEVDPWEDARFGR